MPCQYVLLVQTSFSFGSIRLSVFSHSCISQLSLSRVQTRQQAHLLLKGGKVGACCRCVVLRLLSASLSPVSSRLLTLVILVRHSTSMSSAAGTEQPAAPAQSTEHIASSAESVPTATFESYRNKRIELQSHLSSLIDATVLHFFIFHTFLIKIQ